MDITGQRRAEAERAVAEQQYRGLIEQLPFVTYVNEIEPAYRTHVREPADRGAVRLSRSRTGSPTSELWERVVHPDDLADREPRRGGSARAPRAVRARVPRLPCRRERRLGARPHGDDLRRRRRRPDRAGLPRSTSPSASESEQMFRAVFDNAFEAVLLLDDDGRFVDANPAACDALRALARRARSAVPIGGVRGARARRRRASGAGSSRAARRPARYVLVRPDGARREIEYSAKAHVLPGRHLAVLRDVTERRGARARALARAASSRASAASPAASRTTSTTCSRRFAATRSCSSRARRRAAPSITMRGRSIFAAGRAADLTAQLLAFGRRQTLQAQVVDLNRLVEELGEMAGEDRRRHARGDIRPRPGRLPRASRSRADPAGAAQPGRERRRRDRRARVDRRPHGERRRSRPDEHDLATARYAVVSVEDFGAGLDEGAIENLFEPFFTTKDVGRRRRARPRDRRTGSRSRAAARSSSTASPAAARSSRSICPKRARRPRKG